MLLKCCDVLVLPPSFSKRLRRFLLAKGAKCIPKRSKDVENFHLVDLNPTVPAEVSAAERKVQSVAKRNGFTHTKDCIVCAMVKYHMVKGVQLLFIWKLQRVLLIRGLYPFDQSTTYTHTHTHTHPQLVVVVEGEMILYFQNSTFKKKLKNSSVRKASQLMFASVYVVQFVCVCVCVCV